LTHSQNLIANHSYLIVIKLSDYDPASSDININWPIKAGKYELMIEVPNLSILSSTFIDIYPQSWEYIDI